jgi:hypothetical protein
VRQEQNSGKKGCQKPQEEMDIQAVGYQSEKEELDKKTRQLKFGSRDLCVCGTGMCDKFLNILAWVQHL